MVLIVFNLSWCVCWNPVSRTQPLKFYILNFLWSTKEWFIGRFDYVGHMRTVGLRRSSPQPFRPSTFLNSTWMSIDSIHVYLTRFTYYIYDRSLLSYIIFRPMLYGQANKVARWCVIGCKLTDWYWTFKVTDWVIITKIHYSFNGRTKTS